jgi:hypothetical protein
MIKYFIIPKLGLDELDDFIVMFARLFLHTTVSKIHKNGTGGLFLMFSRVFECFDLKISFCRLWKSEKGGHYNSSINYREF